MQECENRWLINHSFYNALHFTTFFKEKGRGGAGEGGLEHVRESNKSKLVYEIPIVQVNPNRCCFMYPLNTVSLPWLT